MSHANAPAFPQLQSSLEKMGGITEHLVTAGLTKREMIAAFAMQGIHAGYWANNELSGLDPTDFAVSAVQSADALIAELDRTEKKS